MTSHQTLAHTIPSRPPRNSPVRNTLRQAGATLRRGVFGIDPIEATFVRRGFRAASPASRQHLERVGYVFLSGYHLALEQPAPSALGRSLESVEREWRGFAFEGAAMALTLLDCIQPWRASGLRAFLDGPGAAHAYMIHVGAGWALARLPRSVEASIRSFDPLLRWLVVDGYGFHEGYFAYRRRYAADGRPPSRVTGYASRVFDQGLGRSLWFVAGADVDAVCAEIDTFSAHRRADLWAGIGLACTYAGGVDAATVSVLRNRAGDYLPWVAQGAAFAAEARLRAGTTVAHTEMACRVLTGLDAAEAAAITRAAALGLEDQPTCPAYEAWRRRIQAAFL